MKNPTLILALFLGLYVLGTYASSGTIKAMFKKRGQGRDLPLYFKVRFFKLILNLPMILTQKETWSSSQFDWQQSIWDRLKDAMDIYGFPNSKWFWHFFKISKTTIFGFGQHLKYWKIAFWKSINIYGILQLSLKKVIN